MAKLNWLVLVRDIAAGVVCIALVGAGIAWKSERRAERREAARQEQADRDAAEGALKQAHNAARAELDNFFRAAPYVDRGDAVIKVALTAGGVTEHVWISDFATTRSIGRMPLELEGRIGTAPERLPGLSGGDRVTFSRVQIDDWGLKVDGRGHGYFSVRAQLPRMQADEAARIAAFLAPTPFPPGWPDYPAAPSAEKKTLTPRETFLAHLSDPPQSWDDMMVMVAWTELVKKSNGNTVGYAQRTWVSRIEALGNGRFRGVPVNDDRLGQSVQSDQPMEFAIAAIADWGFVEDGVGYGFQTMRKPSPMRSPRQEKALAAFLSADPLPAGW